MEDSRFGAVIVDTLDHGYTLWTCSGDFDDWYEVSVDDEIIIDYSKNFNECLQKIMELIKEESKGRLNK